MILKIKKNTKTLQIRMKLWIYESLVWLLFTLALQLALVTKVW